MIETSHVNELAKELADATDLTQEEAMRVLDLFHVHKLVRNSNELAGVLASMRDKTLPVLGFSKDEIEGRARSASEESFKLENLRLVMKPVNAASGIAV